MTESDAPSISPTIGDRVQLSGLNVSNNKTSNSKNTNTVSSAKIPTGVVAFSGATGFASGLWFGVILDPEFAPDFGKNDGSVDGRRYFKTEENWGIFTRKTKLTKTQTTTNNSKTKQPGVFEDSFDPSLLAEPVNQRETINHTDQDGLTDSGVASPQNSVSPEPHDFNLLNRNAQSTESNNQSPLSACQSAQSNNQSPLSACQSAEENQSLEFNNPSAESSYPSDLSFTPSLYSTPSNLRSCYPCHKSSDLSDQPISSTDQSVDSSSQIFNRSASPSSSLYSTSPFTNPLSRKETHSIEKMAFPSSSLLLPPSSPLMRSQSVACLTTENLRRLENENKTGKENYGIVVGDRYGICFGRG
jgi:hypothetical protein